MQSSVRPTQIAAPTPACRSRRVGCVGPMHPAFSSAAGTVHSQRRPNGLHMRVHSSKHASKSTAVEKMEAMVHEYFQRVLTRADGDTASRILHPSVEHRDMVRDIGYQGVREVLEYVHQVKKSYPDLWVEATEFGPAEGGQAIFAAFEGLATEKTPLFKGIDLFRFNDDITRITEVEVYRSNWQGAKGHQERKKAVANGSNGNPAPN
ncbi:hypothetical protein ACKKBG_A37040 [Auxenochlorella protothecoides x Auxenochlorella symbiontica]